MMKRIIKYICLSILIIFSFYYSDIVTNLLINKSDLMETIKKESNKYNEESVNAIIEDNYIVPGINGLEVSYFDSYNNMDKFDASKLVFKEITPVVSLANNKDLIIKRGNGNKKAVTIIVENNEEVINYNINNKIIFNRLINKNTFNKDVTYIQINNDDDKFEEVENMLDKINSNTNICIISNDMESLCKNYGKYLVKPSMYLNNMNFYKSKDLLAGEIINIADNLTLNKYKSILKNIKYHNLNIISLGELISENRNK